MISIYPEHKQAVIDIMEEGFFPGKLITHEWLKEHLKLNENDINYPFIKLSRVEAFKKELLENYKIHLDSVRGKGYRVVPPEEQTEVAVTNTMNGIQKNIKRGINYLQNVDIAKLTDIKKRENTDALGRIASISGMVKRERNIIGTEHNLCAIT